MNFWNAIVKEPNITKPTIQSNLLNNFNIIYVEYNLITNLIFLREHMYLLFL